MVNYMNGFPDGTPKGMKQVLEKGVNVSKMKVEKMRKNFRACRSRDTIIAYFIPKFHCELNHIKRVWAQSKKYSRANCDYSFKGLEETVELALDSVSLDSI